MDDVVDSFHRLIPYVWPYRQRLFCSIILGFLIAALWGMNLTVAFPVVKILLERKNLHEYVDESLAAAKTEELQQKENLATLDASIADMKKHSVPANSSEYVELLRKAALTQTRMADAQRTQYQFQWVQFYLMPIVPQNEFQTFAWMIIVLLAATAIKGVFIFIQDLLVGSVAESAIMGIRKELLHRVLKLDYQTLSAEGPSHLMSRFTYDAEQLAQGITLISGRLIREPLKCLSCMFLALLFNWRLTVLSLIFIPLLALFLGKFGKMLKRASRRMMESMSQIYKVLEETFSGLKVVIGYDNARHHQELFDAQYQLYYKKAMRVVRIDAAAKPLLEMLGLMALFMALIPGAYLVLRGKTHIWGVRLAPDIMSPAELTVLYAMLAGMLDPCRKLSSGFSRLKRASAAIDRIFGLMDQQSSITDPETPKRLPRHSKSIEFRDVSFRYAASDQNRQRGLVLEHLDLNIQAGEVVAIVGQNGCGKSTLVNLLPRFYDPDSGDVVVDGRSLRDVSLAELRRQVGIVTQDTILFDDTVLENIRYGSPQATRQQVEEAARRAHILPILQGLPQGLDTRLGDQGKELSGGQRQRIAIARVILRDPAILILDEATSAADADSETLIHQTLKEFVKGRTTFVISHSMSQSLLDFVTRIVVLDAGKVVAVGSHESLLDSCPLYHRLFNAPSRQMVAKPKAA